MDKLPKTLRQRRTRPNKLEVYILHGSSKVSVVILFGLPSYYTVKDLKDLPSESSYPNSSDGRYSVVVTRVKQKTVDGVVPFI